MTEEKDGMGQNHEDLALCAWPKQEAFCDHRPPIPVAMGFCYLRLVLFLVLVSETQLSD